MHKLEICRAIQFGVLTSLVALLVFLCSVNWTPPVDAQSENCASCHNNPVALKALSPRWREVLVETAQFAKDKHAKLLCSDCHARTKYATFPHVTDKNPRDPADPALVKETCGKCHAEITTRHLNSLHSTLEGHRLSLIDSMGKAKGEAQFAECTGCHATCTSCHMKQPDKFNRLVTNTASHSFAKNPASNVCQVCHAQTGITYFGDPAMPQRKPSMMASAGMECTDCHSEKEVHGDGKRANFIADTPKPSCDGCHLEPKSVQYAGVSTIPPQFNQRDYAHQTHAEAVDCVGCHTQWYTNCWDCHRGDARVKDNKLYLAVNPTTKKVQTAVHSPINVELGNGDPKTGGWAIKTRHSWGKARACADCHTDADVFVSTFLRGGKFVGVWAKERRDASFVAEKRVAQITLDARGIAQTAHKSTTCEACHNSTGDQACQKCHTDTSVADRSRAPYSATHTLLAQMETTLTQARALNVDATGWDQRRAELQDAYSQIAKQFHTDPNVAQQQIKQANLKAQALATELGNGIENGRWQNRLIVAGIPFAVGSVLAVGLSALLMRRKKNNGEK